MAKIIIPTPLRKLTGNEASFESTGATVEEVINELTTTYPDLKKNILDEEGRLRHFVRIYLGDDDINSLDEERTVVNQESVLSIIPAIAGGIQR